MGEGYDIAQVCLNGHPANSSFKDLPQFNQDYCEKCGERTITLCQKCNTPIRGYYKGHITVKPYKPPSYCYKCGNPFPWIKIKIQAAIEMLNVNNSLSKEDVEQAKECINDFIRDTPHTQVSASRFKRLMKNIGNEATSAIRDILIDVISETAKKLIWP